MSSFVSDSDKRELNDQKYDLTSEYCVFFLSVSHTNILSLCVFACISCSCSSFYPSFSSHFLPDSYVTHSGCLLLSGHLQNFLFLLCILAPACAFYCVQLIPTSNSEIHLRLCSSLSPLNSLVCSLTLYALSAGLLCCI